MKRPLLRRPPLRPPRGLRRYVAKRYAAKYYAAKYCVPLFAALLLSTGCDAVLPSTPLPHAPLPVAEPAHLLTVPLSPGDTRAAVESRYGARAEVWAAGDYAVLGDAAPGRLLPQAVLAEPNRRMFATNGQTAWMSGRSRLWAGGRSRLWAGGRSRLWAGGLTGLWSGTQFLWMPENTALWNQIRLQQGHRLAPNLGNGVKVAVIDTGVDVAHPALLEALAPASEWYDFYAQDALPQEEGTFAQAGYGHGTSVAGIIRQVAPRATILPIRVLGPDGGGDVLDVTAAINHAVAKGARIINLSLGSDTVSPTVETAIQAATAKGVFVVASTGNTGNPGVSFPANQSAVDVQQGNLPYKVGWLRLSVTSVSTIGTINQPMNQKSSFATYGPSVELAAPGENVFGPAPGNLMAGWSGTSMAAPMASGALALALGQRLKVPQMNLADDLRVKSSDLHNNGLNEAYKDQLGKGLLNLEEFLKNVVY